MKGAKQRQRGFSLVEVVVCIAILIVAVGGAVAAINGVARASAPNPFKAAALAEADRVMTTASALAKYSGTLSVAASSWSTTVPIPQSSPLPLTLSLTTHALGGNPPSTQLDLTVSYNAHPGDSSAQTLSLQSIVSKQAPPPASSVTVPDIAQPSGAP
ncbi:MAG: prepilin-type N-terminal cleavage/methylation domain-containing protein [Candidatus Eremiobacteraeota bacterium]|nr:prepilin-type N-terminal cleavage/methylation domain-containing protein [Candidatus Eremiobacteraeota bacterium]